MYELTEIMRQKDDRDFAEPLNRLQEGLQTDEDIAKLKMRYRYILKGEILKGTKTDFVSECGNCTCKFLSL